VSAENDGETSESEIEKVKKRYKLKLSITEINLNMINPFLETFSSQNAHSKSANKYYFTFTNIRTQKDAQNCMMEMNFMLIIMLRFEWKEKLSYQSNNVITRDEKKLSTCYMNEFLTWNVFLINLDIAIIITQFLIVTLCIDE
jgi:hypothetical protein